MAEDKNNPFHGGKQSRRDRFYGIDDPDFWKDEAGGEDLASRERAQASYEELIASRPEAK